MAPAKNRRWLLERRPEGTIRDDDFRLVEEPVGEPEAGQVLVQVQLLSCDPTQRGWLAADTYMPAIGIGEVIRSGGAGRVVASRHPDFAEGDMVTGLLGWQDFAVVDPAGLWPLAKLPRGMQPERALGDSASTVLRPISDFWISAGRRLARRLWFPARPARRSRSSARSRK